MAEAGVMLPPGSAGTSWDAIVIGAGPAGSLAALLMARAGLKVLLVERRAMPRRKVCGGCLNARALASLDRAGLGSRVRALGAAPLHTLRLHRRGRSAAVHLPPGLAVSRHALDHALAAAAVEAGCALLTGTAALVIPHSDSRPDHPLREVSLQTRQDPGVLVSARAVVVADGLGHSSLRECPPFDSRGPASSRVGVGGDGGPGIVDVDPGSITMAVCRHGYAGAVEVEGGRINIAAAVDPSFLRTAGGPAAAVQAMFDDAGVRVNGPLASIEWMGTPPLTRRLSPLADRGVFVLGDAAGYVEPFTGEGMAWAFAGAESLAALIRRATGRPGAATARAWAREHAAIVGRDQRRCRLLASGLRRPALVAASLSIMSRYPGVAAQLIARFSPPPPAATERIP